MDLRQLNLPADALRNAIPEFLAAYVDPPTRDANRHHTAAAVATLSDDDLRRIIDNLATLGDDVRLYPADPGARAISRVWAWDLVSDGVVTGLHHLRAAVEAGPVAVLCNHLSYVDTTATDALLAHHGFADVADRLFAVAGPKVYSDIFRRFAASCLNTLPAPQSTTLEGTARLGPRELAQRAAASLALADALHARGGYLLLYPEGSRTRTGRMRPFLKGVARYLRTPGLQVVPAALTGTDLVFPIGKPTLGPAPTTLTFGAPLRVGDHPSTKAALEATHRAIAALLPTAMQPDPAEPAIA